MTLKGLLGLAARPLAYGFHPPRLRSREDDLALGQVLAGRDTEARLAGVEGCDAPRLLGRVIRVPVLGVPDVTMAGVEEHAVTLSDRCDALPFDHLFYVRR